MHNWRTTIGFMLPSSCLVYEHEFRLVTAGLFGVIGVPARLLITACDHGGLEAMNAHIELASRQLATCAPDLVMYMCTSGSFMNGNEGEQSIRNQISELTGRPVATTAQSVLAAMRQLKLKKVVMLTPYDQDITEREVRWLGSNGIQVMAHLGRNIPENLDRGRQYPETSYNIARNLVRQLGSHSKPDGVFLSCANVRSLEIVDALERDLGIPVVSSSLATTWFALRQCGVHERLQGFGTLLSESTSLVS